METNVDIVMRATGGGEAVAALGEAKAGIESITNSSRGLEGAFGHRFTHIGLQLFAGEALRASGLGMETRAVISTLTLAVTSAAAAFGAASGPILLVGAGLVAVTGIVMKLHEHWVKHHEDLQKIIDQDTKIIQKTDELLNPLEEYRKKVSSLPGYLEALYEAKKKLHDFEVASEVEAIKLQNIELEKNIGMQKKVVAEYNYYTDEQVKMTEKQTKALHDETETLLKNQSQFAENNAKLALFKKGQDDVKKSVEEATKAIDEQAKKEKEAIQKEAEEETRRWQHAAELHQKTMLTRWEVDKKYHADLKQLGESVYSGLGKAFGDATAKMIVEGKSFTETLKSAFDSMAEQIISDIIRIEIEMTIMKSIAGGGFGIMGGGPPMPFASGGSVLVDRPTLFMAGEGGQPEVASFTPLSQMNTTANSGGGGGSVNFGDVNVSVSGVNDPDAIARQVGQKIVEQIRGRGQLQFLRPI